MNKIYFYILILILCFSSASALTLSNVQANVMDDMVIITWLTDQESDSKVSYGISNLNGESESSDLTLTHALPLSNLEEASSYLFIVRSCIEEALCEESNILEFITLGGQVEPPINTTINTTINNTNTTTPGDFFLEVKHDGETIPQYYNNYKINLDVASLPDANIYVKVNGVLKRHKKLGDTGLFTFSGIEMDSELESNEIIVLAEYETQYTSNTFNIILDLIPPVIDITLPKDVLLEELFNMTGSTSEDVELDIYFSKNDASLELLDFRDLLEGEINEPLSFNLGDGKYYIKLEFADKANNKRIFESEFLVDFSDPVVTLNPDFSSLTPTYVDKVRLKGNTKEAGATVVVYVNGRTQSSLGWSANLVSLVTTIGEIIGNGNEYTTISDENGDFMIDVRLSKEFLVEEYLGQRYTEVGSDGRDTIERVFTNVPAWKNEIIVVAFDGVGRQSEPVTGEIVLTTCDYGGDWDINIQQVTPTTLKPIHLVEGIASLGFNYEMDWQGPGDESQTLIVGKPQIRIPTNTVIVNLDDEDQDLAKIIMSSSGILNNYYADMNLGTASIRFSRYPGSEDELRDKYDKLDTMLEMEINYQYDNFGTQAISSQIKCIPVTIALDRTFDVKKPKVLLRKATTFLEWTVNTTDEVLKYVTYVRKATFFASIAGNAYEFIMNAKQKLACMTYASSRFTPRDDDGKMIMPGECDKQDDENCASCWASIESLEKARRINHWVSDRMFCPSIPSLKKYVENTAEGKEPYYVYPQGDSDGGNGDDETSLIHELSACNDELTNEKYVSAEPGVHKDCKAQYEYEWGPSCLGIKDIYKYSFNNTDEFNFFERMISTIDGVCKGSIDSYEDIIHKTGTKKCGKHSFSMEKNDFVDCYYILNPKEPAGLPAGIYEAEYDENRECIRAPDGNCLRDDDLKPILEDKYSTVSLIYENKEPIRIDDVNDPNYATEKEYLDEMELRGLSNYVSGVTGDYVIDPTSSFFRSVQCGCVPAVEEYIRHYRNMADATRLCFEDVLISENVSAGFCKSVLTQYVCDLIYDAIKCGGKFFAKQSISTGPGTRTDGITGFFSAMSNAGEDVSKSVRGRYGATTMFKTMFNERTLLHSACYGAFFGDWNIELESLFAMTEKVMPIKSDVFMHPVNREFISSSPFTGRTTHIYHVNLGIVSGADLTFNLRLACSAENTCDTENGECDCFRTGNELSITTPAKGFLRKGEMYQRDFYIPIQEAGVRYDKAILMYKYKNNQGVEVTEIVERPIKEIGGKPPLTCSFDLAQSQFLCNFDVGERGYASFGQNVPKFEGGYSTTTLKIGDEIILEGEVTKKSASSDETGTENKIVFVIAEIQTIDGELIDNNNNNQLNYYPLADDGVYDLKTISHYFNYKVKEEWFGVLADVDITGAQAGVSAVKSGTISHDIAITFSPEPDDDSTSKTAKVMISTQGEMRSITGEEFKFKEDPGYKLGEIYKDGERFIVEGYIDYLDFLLDGTQIHLSGIPSVDSNNNFAQRINIKSSVMGYQQFKIVISLHYADEANPSVPDVLHSIVNGVKEEKYEIKFSAIPQNSENSNLCEDWLSWTPKYGDDKCNCFGELGPVLDSHNYCYGDKTMSGDSHWVDLPGCLATNLNKDKNPTKENSILVDNTPCYCGEDTWKGLVDPSDPKYCYKKTTDDKPKIHSGEFSV